MKVTKLFLLISLLFISINARHIQKTFLQNSQPAQSLKRLIQFYRSESHRIQESSFEAPVSKEFEIPANSPTFRIHLSSGTPRDDYAPFPDDIPMGSLERVNPFPEATSSEEIVFKETILPSTNASDLAASGNPEEAENEITTMFPVEQMSDINVESDVVVKEVKSSVEDDDDENSDEDSAEQCSEGETKKLGCNNACVCVDGTFFCSKRKCAGAWKAGVSLGNQSEPLGGSNQKKEWGFRKKEPNTFLPTCSSGMTKSIDCNQCVCVMGKWACTKRGCIALTLREKASYTDGVSLYNQVDTLTENKEFDEDCVEGVTRKIECNQCICHLNSWSCSKFHCGPTPPPKEPEETQEACRKDEDVKSRDCNLCKCTSGLWVCTLNDCKTFADKDAAPPSSFRTASRIKKTTRDSTVE